MSKRKFLMFMSLVLAVVVLSWGVDLGWAQSPNSNGNGPPSQPPGQQWTLNDAENAAAALRAAQGLHRGVTNDQRWAAAERNAARRAAADHGKGGQK